MSWTDTERSMLSLMLKREKYGWYVMILYELIYQYWSGSGISILLSLLMCFPLTHCVSGCLCNWKFERNRIVLVELYIEVIQCFHYMWALAAPAEAFSYLFSSTLVLVAYQLSPALPWEANLLLVGKHIGFWYWCFLDSETLHTTSRFLLYNVCWAGYHCYTYLTIKKHILKSECLSLQSLRRKEKHITALYDAQPNGVLVVTNDRKVASYNSVLLEFLSVPSQGNVEETLYSKIMELRCISEYADSDPAADESVTQKIIEYIDSEEKEMKNLGVVLMNGKYLEWRANSLEWDDTRSCIVCVRDITRWIELESIAKRESNSKSALLRSVSHELRTPTNAIINLAQDIKDSGLLSQEKQQDVVMLSHSANFLLNIINDLLDYSSITSGKFGLTKQFFSLKDMVQECVQLIELQCKHKKLELIMRYDPALPVLAYNDKNRLKQVILNLLSNAMKFTMRGKIEVVVVSVSEIHAGIRVIDTGVGISEESIGKIFTLFGKLEGNEKLNPQGCGLGLSISSMLVKSLGGSGIKVKSKRHAGSLFAFEFSIATSEADPKFSDSLVDLPELHEDIATIVVPSSITSKTEMLFPDLLVVDDVDYNRIVLRKIVESVGYSCDEASNGLQVLELVRYRADAGKPYLAILMDVEMPEMDGITATREISAMFHNGYIAKLPVVIGCSAYSAIEDREACLSAGMQHYLEKPIDREELHRLLSNIVGGVLP